MKINVEIKKSIEKQKEGDFPCAESSYPFSLVRSVLFIVPSVIIAIFALWLTYYILYIVASIPENESVLKLGPYWGLLLWKEPLHTILLIFFCGPLQALAAGIVIFILIRMKQEVVIRIFREAIEVVDNLGFFTSIKYYWISDIREVNIESKKGYFWLVVSLKNGKVVKWMIRHTDYDNEELSQEMLKSIRKHMLRFSKISNMGEAPVWRKKLAEFLDEKEFFDWEWEEKSIVIQSLFREISAGLENTRMVVKDDEDRVELRIKNRRIATRVIIDQSGMPVIEIKPGLKSGSFYLYYDEDPPAVKKTEHDPWDEKDTYSIRMITNKIFTTEDTDFPGLMNETLAALESFPSHARNTLLFGLEQSQYKISDCEANEERICANMICLCLLPEPEKDIKYTVRFLNDFVSEMNT